MEQKFWNENIENMPREKLRRLQWEKIKRQMRYIYNKSELYRDKFNQIGVKPDDIRSLDEFRALPTFIDKKIDRETQELTRQKYGHPFGEYLCVDPKYVRAVHSTSGTTGIPVFEAFSKHDIAVENEVLARTFWRNGLRPGDYILHITGLSMWLAGLVPMRAYEFMGLVGIPVGAESGIARVLQFAKLIKAKAMFCIPSFAERMINKAPEVAGITTRELGIEILIAVGEPGAGIPEMRKKLIDGFNARVYDQTGGIYGLSATSCDAEEYQGMHMVGEDYFYMDIIDPETKKPVDMSQGRGIGEVVSTALEWEAAPAFRYAQGDIVELNTEKCVCGMPGMRMRYLGRVDDLLIVQGVNVYPSTIKGFIDSYVPKVTGEMRIILEVPPPRVEPPLKIKVEYSPGINKAELDQLKTEMENKMSEQLRVRPAIELVPPDTIIMDPAKKATLFQRNYEIK
jgi:phenylacetate-CoA ligase